MVVAIVLVCVAVRWGSGVRPESSGSVPDDGLAGATAERAALGSLPCGKQTQAVETAGESETLATATLCPAPLEDLAFANLPLDVDGWFEIRMRRCIAAAGARGPPVG